MRWRFVVSILESMVVGREAPFIGKHRNFGDHRIVLRQNHRTRSRGIHAQCFLPHRRNLQSVAAVVARQTRIQGTAAVSRRPREVPSAAQND